jgi:hypothetical protein
MGRPKKKSTQEKLDELLEVSEEITKPQKKSAKDDYPFPELIPDGIEAEEPVEVEIITPREAAAIVVQETAITLTGNEFQDDFARSKATLVKMLEKAERALDGILGVAGERGGARDYEVAATLIKTAADIAKDIVIMHKTKAEIEKIKFPDGGELPNPVSPKGGDTYVFQGTSLDLLKEIKKAKQAKDDNK